MKKIILIRLILCTPMALADEVAEVAPVTKETVLVQVQKALPSSLKITAFETINKEEIPKSASFGTEVLTRTGTGVRQKKVFFVGVNIYRATLFVSDITKFPRKTEHTLALDSIPSMPALALVLDFKRSVSAKDIAASFETALKKNSVKDSPALIKFKTAVREGGDVANGQRLSLSASQYTLTCEFGKKTVEIKGDAKFIRDVFSIWLGVPADDGLKTLRDMLILGKL